MNLELDAIRDHWRSGVYSAVYKSGDRISFELTTSDTDLVTFKDFEATAKRISSASDLLDALDSMVDAFKDECYLPHKTKAINKATEIIKKAKGL